MDLAWWTWLVLLTAGIVPTVIEVPWSAWDAELRFLSSVVLAAVAWRRVFDAEQAERSVLLFWACGITLGASGDASPMWGRSLERTQSLTIAMLLFGVGHLGYLGAVQRERQRDWGRKNRNRPWWWFGSLLVALSVGVASWWWVVKLSNSPLRNQLSGPALAYSLLLALTAGTMTGLAGERPRFRWVAVGAWLFLLSGILLGLAIFRETVLPPWDGIWVAYGLGQMLIVFGWPQERQRGWQEWVEPAS